MVRGLEVGLLAVVGDVDGEALFFQPLAEGAGEGLVVFDEEDAHLSGPNQLWKGQVNYERDRNTAAMKS